MSNLERLALSAILLATLACPGGDPENAVPLFNGEGTTGQCLARPTFIGGPSVMGTTYSISELASGSANGPSGSCGGVATLGGVVWRPRIPIAGRIRITVRSDVPLRVWVVETAEEWCLNTLACFPPPEPINGDEALGGSGSDYQYSTEVDVAYDLEWFNNLSIQIGSEAGALSPDTLVNFVSTDAIE